MRFTIFATLASIATAALVPPSQDPFYEPKGNWKSQAPGAILAHRPVPNPLPNITYSVAYQLLYRTVDALNDPIAALTTVIIPKNPKYNKLLSYQQVYDTPDNDCSPSYVLQQGGSHLVDDGFMAALAFGWIVNTPDYESQKAAFSVGTVAGQATLDSIRAALASTAFTQIEPDAKVALWGYSGGALASEWAAELQSTYAPELTISGTAIGGTTPNISNVALSVNNHSSAGLIPAALLGFAAAYPNVSTLLNESFVSDADKEQFWTVEGDCIAQWGLADAGKDILGYFKQGPAIVTDSTFRSVVNDAGIMGIHGMPEKSNKLYVYKSTLDEVSPVADTDALVEKYCKAGLTIKYVKDNYGTHSQEATNGGLGAFEFLDEIMDGVNTMKGCVVETRNSMGSVIASSTIAATTTAYNLGPTTTITPVTSETSSSTPQSTNASASSTTAILTIPSAVSASSEGTTTATLASTSSEIASTPTSTGVAVYTGAAAVSHSFMPELSILGSIIALCGIL